MSRRCFSDKPITGPAITIDGGEAHHLLHVLRLSPGDGVTLFDGEGAQYDAEVFSCGRSTVELHVGEAHAVDRELPQLLTLACPLPKGDRQRWIVEKAVELGVTRLIPLQTDRSGSGGGVKLKRYVIEASKQCGRNRLMRIGPQLSWSNWLQFGSSDESGGDQKSRRWRAVAHPGGVPIAASDAPTNWTSAYLAVGPEGGFTDEEIALAKVAGNQIVDLGPRILRIETAAVAMILAATLPSS